MSKALPLRVYLIDDERLALNRLSRLLRATDRTDIVGSTTDPRTGLAFLQQEQIDGLFLDIRMPELSAFELLSKLNVQPPVVFTTAFDMYALDAFEVNLVDYLVKPIDPAKLERSLDRLERLRISGVTAELRMAVERTAAAFDSKIRPRVTRVASHVGDHIEFIDLCRITHFFAKEKLTYAATPDKNYLIEETINELEARLDPKKFFRTHRSTLLNIDSIHEIHHWFGRRLMVRLKPPSRGEVIVARERVEALKRRLGLPS
jgi:two-component system LytT family response regulator